MLRSMNHKPMLLFAATLCIACLAACNKDEDPGGKGRVVKVTSYQDQWKTSILEVTYSNSEVTEIRGDHFEINGNLAYQSLTGVEYPGDSISITDYYDNYGTWIWLEKDIMEMDGDRMMRRSLAYGHNDNVWRVYEYTYDGDRLAEVLYSFHGAMETKTIYDYVGPELAQKSTYSYEEGNWLLSYLDTLYYNDHSLDSMVRYQIDGSIKYPDVKYVYQYQDGLIIHLDQYLTYDTLTWNLYDRYDYEYDAHGNLRSKSHFIGGNVYRDEYDYEPGEGNYWLVTSYPQ